MAPAALHPPDDSLAAFGLGLLDDPAAADVARHLTGCAPCRRRVAELPADPFLGRLRDAVGPRANLRPSSTPSMRYTSHSARARSSGREAMRETTCSSWRSVPGAGTARNRSWYSRSKFGSSTQYG